MESILYEIYIKQGAIELEEVVMQIGNKYTAYREIILISDLMARDNNPSMGILKKQHKDTIIKALLQTNYNQKQAAALLGISRRTMCYYVEKYKIIKARRFKDEWRGYTTEDKNS